MTTTLGITEFDLGCARRKFKRRIAVALITAMAETDADYEFIARRIREKPERIEKWIAELITGNTTTMNEASDLALAMGAELTFGLARREAPKRPNEPEASTEGEGGRRRDRQLAPPDGGGQARQTRQEPAARAPGDHEGRMAEPKEPEPTPPSKR